MEYAYDLVIKGGTLIDPAQQIHEEMDVAVSMGRVEAVERSIPPGRARRVIDASGLIVTPGLIDIHTHCAYKIIHISVEPEVSCLMKGSTTIVDAGSVGELLFPAFKEYIIKRARVRIHSFLNIESLGMVEYERNQEWPTLITAKNEQFASMFVNIKNTLDVIEHNRDTILGIKWAHHGLEILKLARRAADRANCILMAENHYQPETLKYLKKGDVVTHLLGDFHGFRGRPRDGLLDGDMKVQPEFFDARRRGVYLDVGHGIRSFSWRVAEAAFKQGIRPDTISTDLWIKNLNRVVYDLPTTMTKFLLLGMSLDEVIEATTATPAKVLSKENEMGTLKPGFPADITLLRLEEGRFPLTDSNGEVRMFRRRLIPVGVIRGGEVIRQPPV